MNGGDNTRPHSSRSPLPSTFTTLNVHHPYLALDPQPRAAHFEPVQFSVEEGLMTPTFKLKRNAVQDKYQNEIDAMYETYKAANPPKAKL
mmetsp:Transcript_40622/g.108704  ORF Transcript_40622/g.108704 Transcript_40622/m.108704 type:complete len:90 (-) Transcript_40622:620-889(-)